MRFLPRVRPHVRVQAAGQQERLAARPADMRTHPRMRPHVHSKDTGRLERFPARRADVPPDLLVPPPSLPHPGLGFRV